MMSNRRINLDHDGRGPCAPAAPRPRQLTALVRAVAATRALRRAAGTLAIVSLASCALAPGMSFQSDGGNAPNQGGQPPSKFASEARQNLVEITDELIEKQREDQPKGISDNVRKLFGKPQPYVLGTGDVLNIVVWDHPELTMPAVEGPTTASWDNPNNNGASPIGTGYAVDSNGMIQFAYIGMLKVGGLTESEARDLLAARLGRFLRNPQVTLRIQSYRSKRIYVDGEVRTPGLQFINDAPMTLPEAINRAGGFSQGGDRSTIAVTRGETTVVVNIPDLIAKGVNPSQIMLHDGDLVRVHGATDSKVFMLGEVGRPTALTLNNGKLTLGEALGDAGGVNQNSGDARQVYVVRGRGQPKPTVFHLDASSPAAMATADNFELKANDVVFVDASSLVRWSRVFNLLLPSGSPAAVAGAFAPVP